LAGGCWAPGTRVEGGGGKSSQTFRMKSWAYPGSSSDVWVPLPIVPASVPAMAPCLNVPPPCPQTTWLFARLPPPGPSADVQASSMECQASVIPAGPPDHPRGKAARAVRPLGQPEFSTSRPATMPTGHEDKPPITRRRRSRALKGLRQEDRTVALEDREAPRVARAP